MKTSKHMNLKTFFDPSQNHLLHKISLNLSSLSTLCTIIIIAYYKTTVDFMPHSHIFAQMIQRTSTLLHLFGSKVHATYNNIMSRLPV